MSRPGFPYALLLALTPWLAPPAAPQEIAVLLSTSGAAELPEHLVSDAELVSHAPSEGTRIAWPEATLLPFFTEDGGGVHTLPGDLDAVHDPGGFMSDGGLLVSVSTDGQGFADGDVLRLAPGGAVVAFPEELFVQVCAATDGNVDVDAFHVEADGSLLFSFAEDEDSSALSGADPGVIADGDVLRWVPGAALAEVLHTEPQIDALVSQALGSSESSGEVKGLARHPVSGALLFTVQSPSPHDASVFSDAGGGELLAGFDEAQLGFLGSEEADALTVRGQAWPALRPDQLRPAAGSELAVDLAGAEPGSTHLMLLAFDLGPAWLPTVGWGGLVLTDDAMFQHAAMIAGALTREADGAGRVQWTFDVPVGLPPLDVTAQSFELGFPVRASNPILVEGAQ